MNRDRIFSISIRAVRALGIAAGLWFAGLLCRTLDMNRTSAALTLLLGVLACATFRDRLIAVLGPVVASLSLSYYFMEVPYRLPNSTASGIMTLITMLVTAFTASELSIRGNLRAHEAERRREEMGRLQVFSAKLMAAQTVAEAASMAARNLVELCSFTRAELMIGDSHFVWPPESSGAQRGDPGTNPIVLPLHRQATLKLWADGHPMEVSSALAKVIELVLDRAGTFEERAQLDVIRRGDELRTTILNAVAHDFRTPLTSIKAAASALRASSAAIFGPDRELIEVINEEADRLEALIRESLALARLQTLSEIPREACSLGAIISAVISRLARYLDRRRVEIEVPQDLPPVAGDRFLLELMLLQVVDNAWKYSRPGARIVISAYLEDEKVGISVWNEGLRIPDYERQRIFDKFYRGASDRGRTEGSGLGLAIAKSIAEAHQGDVWLEDGADGARFRFKLPMGKALDGDASEPNDPAH